jgi:cytochrome c biogenesis protein CcmG, thiol:disulfide interchange protein DsbE
MRKTFVIVALIAIAGVVHFGTRTRNERVASLRSSASATAPALSLTDLKGERIETASYNGKVVLVNFWAAWCTPCAQEVPQIIALQERHRAEGLEVIGVSMDDTETALREFYAKYKMNYPVIPGNAKIAESYGGILGLPTTLLIARDGHVVSRISGILDFAKLEPQVEELLRER